jgi:hypothetical protein
MVARLGSKYEDDFYDLVLEVQDHGNQAGKEWCYYIVNHTTKVIFWLDKHDANDMIWGVNGITKNGHKSYLSEL